MNDTVDEDISVHFEDACKWIDQALYEDNAVLGIRFC